MNSSLQTLEKFVNKKILTGNWDAALFAMQGFVEQIIYQPQSIGKIIGSAELDFLCQTIGAGIAKQLAVFSDTPIQENLIVYIITKLYPAGGHTAVIADLIQCQPDKQHIFLITDIFQNANQSEIAQRFSSYRNVSWEIATEISLAKKTIWLQQRLKTLAPQATYLFNHHQDSVAIAAVQPGLTKKLYFFHHADHQLCLGIFLPHAVHIDAQSLGFHRCRKTLGIKQNVYWPLVVPDLGQRTLASDLIKKKLFTSTSGSSIKFETPYLFSYADLIPKILSVTQGKHLHIGKLTAPTLKKIRANLSAQGINQENFIYIPWVKSVWQTISEAEVDLYLNSFPISGGRAIIEVMGSGTPIVMHENYRSEYLGQVYLAYSEVFYWRKPAELLSFLSTVTPLWLREHAKLARAHYEKYYAPELLPQAINAENGLLPPDLPSYQEDILQTFLENQQENNLRNLMKRKMMQLLWKKRSWVIFARKLRKKILQI